MVSDQTSEIDSNRVESIRVDSNRNEVSASHGQWNAGRRGGRACQSSGRRRSARGSAWLCGGQGTGRPALRSTWVLRPSLEDVAEVVEVKDGGEVFLADDGAGEGGFLLLEAADFLFDGVLRDQAVGDDITATMCLHSYPAGQR